jgi:hypothetical protein
LSASEWITSFNRIVSVFLSTQVWLKAYYAVILSSGSEESIFLIKSIPSFDTLDHIGPFILYKPLDTFSRISSSVSPSNGGLPHSKI